MNAALFGPALVAAPSQRVIGSADTSGKLRAERYGADRVYTLTYSGKDAAGNTSSPCTTTVRVPKG